MKQKLKMSKRVYFVIILVSCVAVIITLLSIFFSGFANATKEYNNAIEKYNSVVQKYNQIAANTYTESITGIYKELPLLPVADSDIHSMVQSIVHGNRTEKIRKDIQTLNSLTENAEDGIRILRQISNPTASWVISTIKQLKNISGSEAVTIDNDPNDMLGKEGGYTGCIYFSVESLSDSDDKNAIEKGVDGGGAIEIYKTVDDAKARCEYLSQYDNTIFYSGSYVIIGTMVIRISYQLNAQEQFDITDSLIQVLTK